MTNDETRRWKERETGCEPETVASRDGPAAIVRTALADLPAGRALDVATGHGRNARFLADRGWTVDAVDVSGTMLAEARERTSGSTSVNWILADVDSYCFRPSTYDVVTISYFDARHRLSAVKDALAPGGVLCYEHHLLADDGSAGPGARYHFEPGELRATCADLSIERYAEVPADKTVRLIARKDPQ